MTQSLPRWRMFQASALFLLGAAVFSLAHGQAPLYYSNQNQYFLHGLAQAGEGLLHEDWLAQTRDPTPVFSGLVAVTARFTHPWLFHVWYGLLLGAYLAAMLGLFAALAGEPTAGRRWPVFLALLVTIHGAWIRWASHRLLDVDYPWYLQAGVAGQYVLGAMFQPSTFGVLLIVAVALFAHGRDLLAGFFVALTVTVHSTYLLPAALVTAGFLTALVAQARWKDALKLGALTLVLVLPVTTYVWFAFRPTSPEAFAEAQDLLVNFRIPHHARPDLWLDAVAGLQIGWVVLSLALVWGTRLFWALGVPFFLGVALTLAQVATGSDTLALLFPWRISTILVPIATTVVLSRLVALPLPALDGHLARAVSFLVVIVLAAGGVWIMFTRQGYQSSDDEVPLLEFVSQSKRRGDQYLLPVRLPKLAVTTRGSRSSDFKPLPEKKDDPKLIPPEFQSFRLATGAPIFVDFKSIPYQDIEVLQWRARLERAERWQQRLREGKVDDILRELHKAGITHLLVRAGLDLDRPGLEQTYEDVNYQVYRLLPQPDETSRDELDMGKGEP